MDELLTAQETSALTKLAPNTLANWRRDPIKKAILPPLKIGRLVRYRKSDVLAFINNLTRNDCNE